MIQSPRVEPCVLALPEVCCLLMTSENSGRNWLFIHLKTNRRIKEFIKLSKVKRLCFEMMSQWCNFIGFCYIFFYCLFIWHDMTGFRMEFENWDYVMQYDTCEKIIVCMYRWAVWRDRSLLMKRKQFIIELNEMTEMTCDTSCTCLFFLFYHFLPWNCVV